MLTSAKSGAQRARRKEQSAVCKKQSAESKTQSEQPSKGGTKNLLCPIVSIVVYKNCILPTATAYFDCQLPTSSPRQRICKSLCGLKRNQDL